jgi:hypothetical protein
MSKTLPVRKLRAILEEVQDVMEKCPKSGVDFLMRCRYAADTDGEVGVEVDAQAPVDAIDAKLGVRVSRSWTSVGAGEFVLRIHRPATGEGSDSLAALEAAELALSLAASRDVNEADADEIQDMDEIQEALATVRRAIRPEAD